MAAAMLYAAKDLDPAEERRDKGLSVSREEGDALGEGYSKSGLGISARSRGDTLCTYAALYNLVQLAISRGSRGDLALVAGTLEEGVGLSGHTKHRANLARFLDALSAVAAPLRGEAERSALLIGAAEESLREVGVPVYNFYAPDPSLKERAASRARAVLGDAAFEKLREQGRATTFEEAVRLGAGAPADDTAGTL